MCQPAVSSCARGVCGAGEMLGWLQSLSFHHPLFLWHFLLYFHHPSAYSSAQATWITGGPSKSGNPPPSSDFGAFVNEAGTKSWIWSFSLSSSPKPFCNLNEKKPNKTKPPSPSTYPLLEVLNNLLQRLFLIKGCLLNRAPES